MRFFAWDRFHAHAPLRAAVAVAIFLFGDLLWIQLKFPTAAKGRTFTSESLPPPPRPVLVLGAGVYRDREPSPLLQQRLQTALDLYRAGKVRWFLVSGDNRETTYNEPQAMRRWLIRQGVPPTHIVSDYAGTRTWDSLKRSQVVFGLNRVVVVTSAFHLPRALHIAQELGMEAVGVPAPIPEYGLFSRMGLWMREHAARHVALWDSWFPPDTRLGPREATPEDWMTPAGRR